MKSQSTERSRVLVLTESALLTAAVYIATTLLKVPVPVTQGYIHLGDGLILLGAGILGWPAVAAAAIGSALADLLGGYTLYVLPTLLIKAAVAATAVLFLSPGRPRFFPWLGYLVSELIMVAGYFLAEWIFLGYGLAGALSAVPANLVQGLSGVIIAAALSTPLQKAMKAARL